MKTVFAILATIPFVFLGCKNEPTDAAAMAHSQSMGPASAIPSSSAMTAPEHMTEPAGMAVSDKMAICWVEPEFQLGPELISTRSDHGASAGLVPLFRVVHENVTICPAVTLAGKAAGLST